MLTRRETNTDCALVPHRLLWPRALKSSRLLHAQAVAGYPQ